MIFSPPGPPAYAEAQFCIHPSYQISSCNVTGLWPVYNESIAQACRSFIDPFNFRYQNHFCYLCNTDSPLHPDQFDCTAKWNNRGLHKDFVPAFTALIDLEKDTDETTNDKQLNCNIETQYKDEIKVGKFTTF